MAFQISAHEDPPQADWDLVDEGLGRFNDAAAPLHEVRKLACFARAPEGKVLGGALGRRWGRCAEIQELWVDEALRGQGLGAALVGAFERAAAEQGCTIFYLETLSFQAPGFYERLGYRTVYLHDVYPHGIVKHLMRKDLAPHA